ncbi:MAG TPA: hypothetical protein VGT08_11035 [Terracidiphilus sp.]|nr:hypothetical protein [Terracidiphilus sp.]
MGIEPSPSYAASNDCRRVNRVGAIAALLIAVGYIVIIPLYARVGAPPHDGDSWFSYLPGKTSLWWAILWISVFTDLLYLPLTLALYQALRESGKIVVRMSCALIVLFVALDLAITWSNYASILTLFARYSQTADPGIRAACAAAADYGSAILASPLEIVYAIVILSSGILLISLNMWKGPFSRITASLGVATGALGLLSLTGAAVAIIGNALFATVWLVFVAFGLRVVSPAKLHPRRRAPPSDLMTNLEKHLQAL